MGSLTRVCIYCLAEKELTAFPSSGDHVLPRAFGTFINSPTLDCVCNDCNWHFGRTIELAMGRDSLEALLRLFHGVKPAEEVKDLGRTRIAATLDLPDPDWKGCYVEWTEEEGQVVASLVPQVGFSRLDGSGWSFVKETDLRDMAKPLPIKAGEPGKLRPIAPSKEIVERLIGVLARRGIRFQKVRDIAGVVSNEEGVCPLDITGRMDDAIFRCVGKIAFNYLAWRQGADWVRSESFNAIRAFIFDGTQAPYPLVVPRAKPILADDTIAKRQTTGHLVTASWTSDNRHVVGQVSLFNSTMYAVSLAKDFTGVWRPQCTGHHFNLETRRIDMLVMGPDSRPA